MAGLTPIPGPQALPLLGNAFNVDGEYPLGSLEELAETFGPVYRLYLLGFEPLFLSSHELVNDACDEKRFDKALVGPLRQLRYAVHDGLFTAWTEEHNWQVAHRTLMSAFGPLPIRSMFTEMHDVASQLVLKWARFGGAFDIDVTNDFTRLTLDTIGLCAMGFRFNSFYREDMHPFVDAMVGVLSESSDRSRRPDVVKELMFAKKQKFLENIAFMSKVSLDLIQERRNNPTDKKDLLNAMLNNQDPRTGQGLTNDSIVDNMITFLVAGHETTSGLLSFLFYELCAHPDAYRQAQEEVDRVIGKTATITVDHMSQLPYLSACLRETLRLHPTAPVFAVRPKEDDVLGGKYAVKKHQTIAFIITKLHTDPAVWGDDAEVFKPERMLDESFSKLPANAWKPFGNGVRACIGRPFAWQEALLTFALLMQVFDFKASDPSYRLKVMQTLTIKPLGFNMRATLRNPALLEKLPQMLGAGYVPDAETSNGHSPHDSITEADVDAPTINIFFGSNTGTCESLASSLATSAKSRGFNAKVNILDKATDALSATDPTVIITASYEGEAPDNAAQFVSWLDSVSESSLSHVKYGVFGVGNREWVTTYQKIPTKVDNMLAAKGGTRLIERGIVDVADGDIFDIFDEWADEKFWPAIIEEFGAGVVPPVQSEPGLSIEVEQNSRTTTLRHDVQTAMVVASRVLTAPGKAEKRHLLVKLPTGMTYKAGDYLAVLPINPIQSVRRAMVRFELTWDATVTVKQGSQTTLPTGRPISAFDILSCYVELGQPVTSKQVTELSSLVPNDEKVKQYLTEAAGPRFKELIQAKNVSLLDILEKFPSVPYTLGQYLAAVPAMRTRQYSISSSPIKDPTAASLTYSVVDAPARSGGLRFLGVASNYLAQTMNGDHVQVSLRPSHAGFRLPDDDTVPVVMACAGTGLAPFRAFVQERALKIESGAKLGPAILFYGCNAPDEDDMYRDEFDYWTSIGAVDVRRAYTFAPQKSEDCMFVQHRVWHDRAELVELFKANARMYICGAGVVGSAISETAQRIYREYKDSSEEEAKTWFNGLRGERYWADIFS